ncbi:MAG: helix-turn-helix domain-containing protein [Suilimivivens sp.]
MNVTGIGNNILKLRRKKGITQEALAEFIGVTKTSVSKWETGTTLPDIQILPLLASYFEVSVDELIGYTPMLSKEQISFQYHRLAEEFAAKPFGEVMAECERLIRKYYACYPFLQQMVILFINHMGLAEGQEKEKVLTTSFDLCEHILSGCQDVGICNNIVAMKGLLNLQCGRADLVIGELEEETLNVNLVEDKGSLLTLAYLMSGKMEQAEKTAQIGMYRSLMDLIGYGMHLLQARGADTEYGLKILERLDGLMEKFDMIHLNPNTLAGYEYQAAVFLAGKEEALTDLRTEEEWEKKVFERLENYMGACKQLFADGIVLHGDGFFSCLDDWFADLELGTSGVRSESQVRESVIQGLGHPAFVKLKNQERLQKMKEDFQNAFN